MSISEALTQLGTQSVHRQHQEEALQVLDQFKSWPGLVMSMVEEVLGSKCTQHDIDHMMH